jgi:hypothetical protein
MFVRSFRHVAYMNDRATGPVLSDQEMRNLCTPERYDALVSEIQDYGSAILADFLWIELDARMQSLGLTPEILAQQVGLALDKVHSLLNPDCWGVSYWEAAKVVEYLGGEPKHINFKMAFPDS